MGHPADIARARRKLTRAAWAYAEVFREYMRTTDQATEAKRKEAEKALEKAALAYAKIVNE